ncbi:hypothetical protein MHM84_09290 [Halomonas sp. McH1-25]|uniref:hypothetical protein n=1 Tax=unclassified Halomonas TaxID=2609666 RepID=UPI001EF6E5F6|nr:MULTISPECIES: hypothetical protein [unclassified Halomonas]MCG7599982.1 hypothetical protein [Halomonas sp. McH1-25]MCP1343393.1 hypothetical protein [Halomonas sp. FL8]MCP1360450.1 hypothetical protein [Halomonas sp. BBD45]MCP1363790.1 hypothetical protein [Halomonas sp. BBD48]
MEKRKMMPFATLLLIGALLGGCGDTGESNETDSDVPGEETMDREPGTSIEDE